MPTMPITPLKIGMLLLPISAAAAMYGKDQGSSLLMRHLTVQSMDAADLLEDADDLVSVRAAPRLDLSGTSGLEDLEELVSVELPTSAELALASLASANLTAVGPALLYRPLTHGDIFRERPGGDVAREYRLFHSAAPDEWCIFASTIVVLLLLECFVLRRFANGGFFQNMMVLCFWVGVGLAYNGYFFARYGVDEGFDWFTGYLLEWLLSIDNLFVFHLVFKVYKTPQELIPKALFFGIVGAVFFKMLFFLFIGELIRMAHVFQWFFGALLVYSGIDAAMSADTEEDDDVEDTYGVRFFRFCLGDRLRETYDREESRLFLFEDGRMCPTLLVLVVFCLECTDIVFAVDSVSAKVAQIPNQYIAYSSSVFAMFGLRAMFFIIKDLVDVFELLKYGICVILCFVGCQLMLADWIDLSSTTVCFVILSVFTICLVGSVATKRWASYARGPAQSAKELGA